MKTGVAIIACDRQMYTRQCIDSLFNFPALAAMENVDRVIIINDGEEPVPENDNLEIEEIKTPKPYSTVGVAKNLGIKTLINEGCEHIFLIENDILVRDGNVFKKYIETSQATGITHLNFGYHGPANRTPDYTKPNPRAIIEYNDGIKLALNPHSVGAFSYFHKSYIENVGYHDTFFQNAWEHVELCQRGISKGLLPAFWWFPDVAGSNDLLEEIPGSIEKSSITHTEKWVYNMQRGADYYKKQHGHIPIHSPDTPQAQVLERLKQIYHRHND